MTMTTEPIVTWPATERAEFLAEIAQQVGYERGHTNKPYTRAARELLPHIASFACPEPLVLFDRLVDATVALSTYNTHPRWHAEADAEERNVDRLVRQIIDGPTS